MQKIAVYTHFSALEPTARTLAEQLHLPFSAAAVYLLLLTPDYLGLQKTNDSSLPLYVDFQSGKMTYRRQHSSLRREALARALGLKKRTQPLTIIDATAGLARDSFIIAALGFEITLIERSPIIHALVQDGIQRASKNPKLTPIMQRMHLIQGNAIPLLKNLADRPDIIYLDPMFPTRTKSALPKKEMRIFHEMIGDDNDAAPLLNVALTCATERVVVKRPRLAPELAGIKPHVTFSGSSSRFDVYLC
ncbi:MAG: hypothetical protein ACD_45C00253G0001 [uncultured bacterium]|nr:MAG: hypothetical protein ACD_45C00253G0001 [uncultured bacterium]